MAASVASALLEEYVTCTFSYEISAVLAATDNAFLPLTFIYFFV